LHRRPNILLIVSDQHAQRVAGCYGDRAGVTPHLDRLAANGIVFENAYCQSPICVPSRMSLTTGLQPFRQQCWTNSDMLPSDVPSWAHQLGALGYRTALIGRMHFIGPDQLHGFAEREIGDHSSNWPGTEGFDHGALAGTAGPTVISVDKSGPGCNAYDLKDRDTAAAAIAWLRRAAQSRRDAPFLLTVGFMLPHPPYVCNPEDYAAVADAVSPPLLPRPNAEHPWLAKWRIDRDISPLPLAATMRARRAFYGLVRRMDALIGQLLATLHEVGLTEDTVVIYLSDHGDHLGERGLFWKHTFFDESTRVPLIVSAPSRLPSGVRRSEVVGLVDLFPTLVALAGGRCELKLDGQSLLPLLSDAPAAPPTGSTFSEYCQGTADSWSTSEPVAQRMIRDGWLKLNYYHGYRPELYDLASDPMEQRDLAEEPAYAADRARLERRVLEEWNPEAILQRLRMQQSRTAVIKDWARATQPPEQFRWAMPPDKSTWVDNSG
jgi:choline-sulfatase